MDRMLVHKLKVTYNFCSEFSIMSYCLLILKEMLWTCVLQLIWQSIITLRNEVSLILSRNYFQIRVGTQEVVLRYQENMRGRSF